MCLTALFSGTTQVSWYQKGKPIWILLKKETASGSGISWAVCKSAPCSKQITMPAPHNSVFLQARRRSSHPTNSVKALKTKHCRRLKQNKTNAAINVYFISHLVYIPAECLVYSQSPCGICVESGDEIVTKLSRLEP